MNKSASNETRPLSSSQPRPHGYGYLWIRNVFFADSAFLNNVSGESGIRIRSPEWKFLNTLRIRNRADAKSGYIFIRPGLTWSSPVFYLWYLRWLPSAMLFGLTSSLLNGVMTIEHRVLTIVTKGGSTFWGFRSLSDGQIGRRKQIKRAN